jgi:RNA polymerase sigma factor (sigma-70 family)
MPGSLFPTTRRSVVEALRSEDVAERSRAYDTLAGIYWKPLYKYARVIRGHDPIDAEDLTQSFMLELLEGKALESYDSMRASFRTFLRLLFDRSVANLEKKAARIKRGGGATHVDFSTAEVELSRERGEHADAEGYFERQWVRSLLAVAVDRCREVLDPVSFEIFEAYDLASEPGVTYAQLAAKHGVTEMTVTNRLAAARRRFREIAIALVRDVTVSDREFRSEVRALFGIDV